MALRDELRISIATRHRMNYEKGLDTIHANRVIKEERLLREIEKILSGS